MGMFDYVTVNCRLPSKREAALRLACNPFQSKSLRLWKDPRWEARAYDEGCVTAALSEDGLLISPDGEHLIWTGDLNFYGAGPKAKWVEFTARLKNGVVTEIKADELPKHLCK